MERIDDAAAHREVERDLGDHGEDQQAQNVLFQIARAEVALHDHKRKDREGKTADTGQPVAAGDDRAPEMIAKHEQHCHDVQGKGGNFQSDSR